MPDLGAVQFLVAPGLGAFHAHLSVEDSWQGEISALSDGCRPADGRRGTARQTARLEELVIARDAAAVSFDAEVRRLRRLGASWPQLAAALGVSRQAALQRYGP